MVGIRLEQLPHWTFNQYFFIAIHALLLPERLDEYRDYRGYFYPRRHWLFATLALVYLVDLGDTWLTGEA